MLKRGLLFAVIFAILAVSAAVALERNLGAFDLVLEDNFQYDPGYNGSLNHPDSGITNLLSGHRISAGETYTIRMRFTASRDLEDILAIGFTDGTEEANWWTILSNVYEIEDVRANQEVSITMTFTTIAASTCSSDMANILFFGTGGEGRLGTAGSGVRGPVTLHFTEFVLSGGPVRPNISFSQTAFLRAENWSTFSWPVGGRGLTGSVQRRRDTLQRQQRDVIAFTTSLPRNNELRHVSFSNHSGVVQQRIQASSGIRFKVFGDRGQGWRVELGFMDGAEYISYGFPIETINNEIVQINIPFSSLIQDEWQRPVPFDRSNITQLVISRRAFDNTISGASTIRIFDFETY